MKHFSPAKLIGLAGLLVVGSAGSAAMAAPPAATPVQPGHAQQQAPSTCEGMTGGSSSTSDTMGSTVSGDPYGPEALVADALSKVCLSDDQRGAVEQLGREVKPKAEEVSTARHAFVTTLAEQVRADNFDDSALKSKIDDLVKAREDASPVLRKALEDLHAILDTGQRAAFVDAIEGDMKQISDALKGRLDSLATDLGLSDDQKSRIKDVLTKAQADNEVDRDRAKAVFDAFKGDQFSIDQIAPESDVGMRTRQRDEQMVSNARQIADILTADQRSKLADKIESRVEGGGSSTGTPSTMPPSTRGENLGTTDQSLFVGGGYRAGAVRGWGWGGGYYGGRYGAVRTGYAAGYPFGGYYGVW